MHTDFADICPDHKKERFSEDVNHLIGICVHEAKSNRSRKFPSKVKGELDSLALHVRGLSPDARNVLDRNPKLRQDLVATKVIESFIREGIANLRRGRSKRDSVRAKIGYDGGAIWFCHGGKLNSRAFVDFLEILIEDINKQLDTPIKVNADNLARAVRKSIYDIAPEGWTI